MDSLSVCALCGPNSTAGGSPLDGVCGTFLSTRVQIRGDVWASVHRNCAAFCPAIEYSCGGGPSSNGGGGSAGGDDGLWADMATRDPEEIWGNLPREVLRGDQLQCTFCGLTGATIGCSSKRCSRSYHFRCAIASGWTGCFNVAAIPRGADVGALTACASRAGVAVIDAGGAQRFLTPQPASVEFRCPLHGLPTAGATTASSAGASTAEIATGSVKHNRGEKPPQASVRFDAAPSSSPLLTGAAPFPANGDDATARLFDGAATAAAPTAAGPRKRQRSAARSVTFVPSGAAAGGGGGSGGSSGYSALDEAIDAALRVLQSSLGPRSFRPPPQQQQQSAHSRTIDPRLELQRGPTTAATAAAVDILTSAPDAAAAASSAVVVGGESSPLNQNASELESSCAMQEDARLESSAPAAATLTSAPATGSRSDAAAAADSVDVDTRATAPPVAAVAAGISALLPASETPISSTHVPSLTPATSSELLLSPSASANAAADAAVAALCDDLQRQQQQQLDAAAAPAAAAELYLGVSRFVAALVRCRESSGGREGAPPLFPSEHQLLQLPPVRRRRRSKPTEGSSAEAPLLSPETSGATDTSAAAATMMQPGRGRRGDNPTGYRLPNYLTRMTVNTDVACGPGITTTPAAESPIEGKGVPGGGDVEGAEEGDTLFDEGDDDDDYEVSAATARKQNPRRKVGRPRRSTGSADADAGDGTAPLVDDSTIRLRRVRSSAQPSSLAKRSRAAAGAAAASSSAQLQQQGQRQGSPLDGEFADGIDGDGHDDGDGGGGGSEYAEWRVVNRQPRGSVDDDDAAAAGDAHDDDDYNDDEARDDDDYSANNASSLRSRRIQGRFADIGEFHARDQAMIAHYLAKLEEAYRGAIERGRGAWNSFARALAHAVDSGADKTRTSAPEDSVDATADAAADDGDDTNSSSSSSGGGGGDAGLVDDRALHAVSVIRNQGWRTPQGAGMGKGGGNAKPRLSHYRGVTCVGGNIASHGIFVARWRSQIVTLSKNSALGTWYTQAEAGWMWDCAHRRLSLLGFDKEIEPNFKSYRAYLAARRAEESAIAAALRRTNVAIPPAWLRVSDYAVRAGVWVDPLPRLFSAGAGAAYTASSPSSSSSSFAASASNDDGVNDASDGAAQQQHLLPSASSAEEEGEGRDAAAIEEGRGAAVFGAMSSAAACNKVSKTRGRSTRSSPRGGGITATAAAAAATAGEETASAAAAVPVSPSVTPGAGSTSPSGSTGGDSDEVRVRLLRPLRRGTGSSSPSGSHESGTAAAADAGVSDGAVGSSSSNSDDRTPVPLTMTTATAEAAAAAAEGDAGPASSSSSQSQEPLFSSSTSGTHRANRGGAFSNERRGLCAAPTAPPLPPPDTPTGADVARLAHALQRASRLLEHAFEKRSSSGSGGGGSGVSASQVYDRAMRAQNRGVTSPSSSSSSFSSSSFASRVSAPPHHQQQQQQLFRRPIDAVAPSTRPSSTNTSTNTTAAGAISSPGAEAAVADAAVNVNAGPSSVAPAPRRPRVGAATALATKNSGGVAASPTATRGVSAPSPSPIAAAAARTDERRRQRYTATGGAASTTADAAAAAADGDASAAAAGAPSLPQPVEQQLQQQRERVRRPRGTVSATSDGSASAAAAGPTLCSSSSPAGLLSSPSDASQPSDDTPHHQQQRGTGTLTSAGAAAASSGGGGAVAKPSSIPRWASIGSSHLSGGSDDLSTLAMLAASELSAATTGAGASRGGGSSGGGGSGDVGDSSVDSIRWPSVLRLITNHIDPMHPSLPHWATALSVAIRRIGTTKGFRLEWCRSTFVALQREYHLVRFLLQDRNAGMPRGKQLTLLVLSPPHVFLSDTVPVSDGDGGNERGSSSSSTAAAVSTSTQWRPRALPPPLAALNCTVGTYLYATVPPAIWMLRRPNADPESLVFAAPYTEETAAAAATSEAPSSSSPSPSDGADGSSGSGSGLAERMTLARGEVMFLSLFPGDVHGLVKAYLGEHGAQWEAAVADPAALTSIGAGKPGAAAAAAAAAAASSAAGGEDAEENDAAASSSSSMGGSTQQQQPGKARRGRGGGKKRSTGPSRLSSSSSSSSKRPKNKSTAASRAEGESDSDPDNAAAAAAGAGDNGDDDMDEESGGFGYTAAAAGSLHRSGAEEGAGGAANGFSELIMQLQSDAANGVRAAASEGVVAPGSEASAAAAGEDMAL